VSENTKIEWADHTFNPWEGCQKVGPGCDHCYAEARNARFGGGVAPNWGPGAPRRRTSVANWNQPLKWDHKAWSNGARARVFCASLADVFDNTVDPEWRADLFALIQRTQHLDWLLLTKRIGNVLAMLPPSFDGASPYGAYRNVWIGATVVNQEEADRDIPKLLDVPARVRFLSIEPMLGPVDLSEWLPIEAVLPLANPWRRRTKFGEPDSGIGWVIVGGESGPGARPMHPQWARDLRDQCAAAGVAYLFKQWGEWSPWPVTPGCDEGALLLADKVRYLQGDGREPDGHFRKGDAAVRLVGKKAAGRILGGRTWDEFPA
jgi:protein gp37